MISIHFSHPQYLLLLPITWAFTWWVLRESLADLGQGRARLAAALRAILLTLVILALAGFQLVRPTKNMCTVFVVDVSKSVPQDEHEIIDFIKKATSKMKPGDKAALVAFGADAMVDHAVDDTNPIDKIVSLPNRDRTDIAAGIQLAMASFPADSGKQVILFSDGNENLGNAIDQAGLALSSDVHISVYPLKRDTSHGEALLLHTEAPREVKQGAPFQVSVLAEAQEETDGTITLYRNNTPVQSQKVHLPAGKKVINFEQSVPESGQYEFKAILDVPADKDSVPDNNMAYTYTRVAGKPKVLVVENSPDDGRYLVNALRANDINVEVGGPDRLPKTMAESTLYDSIMLANVPAWRMSPTQMSIIRSAVRDTGMGFAMVGGENSFGAGGYYHTPIEEALPVSMDVKKMKTFPSVAIALIIEDLEIQTITNTSIEAAKASVELLEPYDKIGVLGCNGPGSWGSPTPAATTGMRWEIDMQNVTNRDVIKHKMDSLQGLGDPPNYNPYLLEAAHKLQNTDAKVKHIILIGDGDATFDMKPGQLDADMSKIRGMGITVSAIATGIDGPEASRFMERIAYLGRGQAYTINVPEDLPRFLIRDQQSISKPPIVEETFRVRPNDTSHPITEGVDWAGSPPLLGYVVTTPKETPSARMLLMSHKDEPVLAAWPYGLGRTVAFTSDATSHWGAHWLGWGSYPPFWARSLRWTLRQSDSANFQTTVTEDHGRATIVVEAITPQGEFRNMLDMEAHVAHVGAIGIEGPEVTQESLTLEQTAPGRYEAGFDARDTGEYTVTVEEKDKDKVKGVQTATIVIPYSPEFQTIRANTSLLGQIAERAHGFVKPNPIDVYGKLRFQSHQLKDLWPFMLFVMAVLFLLDVAVRRIMLPWEEIFGLIKQAILGRLPSWNTATAPAGTAAHSPTLGNLLGTKEKVRRPIDTGNVPDTSDLRRKFQEQSGPMPSPTQEATSISPQSQQQAPPPPAEPTSTAGVLLKKKRERGKL